jgi:hypothetical protein
VPPQNTSSATRVSSSGATLSRTGVIVKGSRLALAPLANTGVLRSLNDSS